jgi:monoamine oxidase
VRVLIQASRRFWEGDPKMPSINLETGDAHMGLVYQTADEVPGDRCVLMGSGPPYETPEDTLKAFRAFYPGSPDRLDAIEKCIIHSWVKEEPYAHGCERHAWGLGELKKIWPHFIQPVGNTHFVGSAYDALPWGQDAATRSAARVAQLINESV